MYTSLPTQIGQPPAYTAYEQPTAYEPSRVLPKKNSRISIRTVESADFPYDRALGTRNLCVFALVCCWLAGVSISGFGIYILYWVHTGNAATTYWRLPHMVAEGIPLAINLLVTLLVETTGYIHTASLRWALQREGRLTFNSNLRLLSFAKTSRPNKWYANFLVLVFITLAYASSSLVFWHSNKATDITSLFSTGEDYVSVGGFPILFLGLCFLGLAAMSNWALVATKIPCWSSSPLDTAFAAMCAGNIRRQPHRCMKSVHAIKEPSVQTVPRPRQRGAWTAHWEVRWVLFLLWSLVIACFAWAGLTSKLIKAFNPEVPSFGGWSLVPNNESSQLYFAPPINNIYASAFCIIALYALLQGPLTFGLHCAELQVNLSRDEAFWRNATKPKGCRLEEYNSIKAAFTSWQSILLAAFKTIAHWVFGLCVQVLNNRVYFGPVQIVYLAFLASVCAIYVTYISTRRPKGPQPAAYGHLQTLVDLVDQWETTLFWGHKADAAFGYGVCHAGTAPFQLPGVIEAPYCG